MEELEASRILVAVADDKLRQVLENTLYSWGYEVVSVSDGLAAWKLMKTETIWLLITQRIMPGINGMELCRRVRQQQFPSYVYAIMLTPESHKHEIVAAMAAGADEFVIEPVVFEALRARIMSAQRILRLERTLAARNRDLEKTNDQLEEAQAIIHKDLEAAARIQQGLLPIKSGSIHGFSFDSLFIPCQVVGGDMFNFFLLDPDHVVFYLLDVSGHGIPAALLSVAVSKTISSMPYRETLSMGQVPDMPERSMISPASVVRELDQLFQSTEMIDKYFTMIYGVLHKHSGRVDFTQAGHPHPILLPFGREPELVGTGGLPVGLVPEAEFTETSFTMNDGDRLIIYSDGVTDCTNPAGERFEMDRLLGAIKTHQDLPMDMLTKKIGEELSAFNGQEEFDDDISLLVLEKNLAH